MQFTKTVLLSFSILISCSALAAEPKRDAAYYQKMLDKAQWIWNEHEAGIFYSCARSGSTHQIELIRPPGIVDELTIRFVKDGQTVAAWKGHTHSVFLEKDDILVYALFNTNTQGCTLVAVDLSSGAKLWRTELKAIPKAAHSGYINYINMHIQDDVVFVRGKEGFGNYEEVVDFKTGKELAYRLYPKEEKKKDIKEDHE
jgi:hypothetical protein